MLLVGTAVTIRAADDFFAYVDGWTGTVAGERSGVAVVDCWRGDGKKTLFVPWAQLEEVKA